MLAELDEKQSADLSKLKMVAMAASTDFDVAALALAVCNYDVAVAVEFVVGNKDDVIRHPFVPVMEKS